MKYRLIIICLAFTLSGCASVKRQGLALTGFTGYSVEKYEGHWIMLQWKSGQRTGFRCMTDENFKDIDDLFHIDGKSVFANGWGKIQPEKRPHRRL